MNVHYEFEFRGSAHNIYAFSTADDIGYEIKFVPSSYLFLAYPGIDVETFEMVISVADNPTGKRLPADKLVAPTIFAIFEDFFLTDTHVVIYICDSSDGRAQSRQRKFSGWFYGAAPATGMLAKLDRAIMDGHRVIYLSLIMNRLHPQFAKVADVFARLGEEEK